MKVCSTTELWLVRRVPWGSHGNWTAALDIERHTGVGEIRDFIKRPVLGVYQTRADAYQHPTTERGSAGWVVIKRLCDPGWDYLPRIAREVFGSVPLDEEDEEYVEAVAPTKIAAQLFIEEWDANYDWRDLRL